MEFKLLSDRIENWMRPSIFEEYTAICVANKSINFSQGAPDIPPPKFLKEALAEVAFENEDQYCRSFGHIELVKTLAGMYSEKFGRKIDPFLEVAIANGASGILGNIMQSFINPDDEIIIFSPAFQYHFVQAEIFKAKCIMIPLIPPSPDSDEFKFDFEAFENSLNERTKFLLLNTPQNPTGKMLTDEEIKTFTSILKKWPNIIVISDEVYEFMTFDNKKHLSIGSYPDMWDRTITVYSLGKTFSCTGWRAGYAFGPDKLIAPINNTQSWFPFCISRPIQAAFNKALIEAMQPYKEDKSFFDYLTLTYNQKKDRVLNILRNAPLKFRVFNPDGGFFCIVDIQNIIKDIPIKYFYKSGEKHDSTPVGDWKKLESPRYTPDGAFSIYLTVEYGVTPLPLSPFYNNDSNVSQFEWKGTNLVRFNLCKSEETIDQLEKRLLKK